jgi:hypothetical protein
MVPRDGPIPSLKHANITKGQTNRERDVQNKARQMIYIQITANGTVSSAQIFVDNNLSCDSVMIQKRFSL